MARIEANGMTRFGKMNILIIGDGKVESIKCADEDQKYYVEKAIEDGEGSMANAYFPPAGSMLQAFAYLTNIFENYDDVNVYGDIGEIPISDTPGAVY